jgi:hypothetical protein
MTRGRGRPRLYETRVVTTIRLPPGLKAAIDAAAKENYRTATREIELRLTESFSRGSSEKTHKA